MADLFESIRDAAAEVVRRARHVTVTEHSRLREYARSLPLDGAAAPALDPRHHFLGTPDQTVAFVLTLDTINFGSGYFPHLRKRPGFSGYFTVATCLTERFRAGGPLSGDELARLTPQDCAAMFEQVSGNPAVDELMGLFARALNDLGRMVRSDFAGEFTKLVGSANHSAEQLVRVLSRMPFFRDVQRYDGQLDVPFYKRAQLTAADLSLALRGEGLGRFDDLHRLTIFADNLVPHVLRVDGVLRYDADLARRVDAGELIIAGSAAEIEIRAAAVHVSERIVEELRQAGHNATAMKIDYLLWNRGQQRDYKARPRHRARGVFY